MKNFNDRRLADRSCGQWRQGVLCVIQSLPHPDFGCVTRFAEWFCVRPSFLFSPSPLPHGKAWYSGYGNWRYQISQKRLESTSLAKTRVWAILTALPQMSRAKGDVSTWQMLLGVWVCLELTEPSWSWWTISHSNENLNSPRAKSYGMSREVNSEWLEGERREQCAGKESESSLARLLATQNGEVATSP